MSERFDLNEPIDVGPDQAANLIGKTVLAQLTYIDSDERILEKRQWFGVIEGVGEMLEIRDRATGELRTLPPRLLLAAPGEYHLHATGEVVRNPDFLTTWEVFEGPGDPPGFRPDVPPGGTS